MDEVPSQKGKKKMLGDVKRERRKTLRTGKDGERNLHTKSN